MKNKYRVKKVIVAIGIGQAPTDAKLLPAASQDLMAITGQKPKVCLAKKAESDFKIREGDPIGLMVTLRGKRMANFIKKLVAVVLPRIRDFQGVSPHGFDGHGNYSLGIVEQIVFPEVEYTQAEKKRGLGITFVTDAKKDQEARKLLESLGMPFAQSEAEEKNGQKK